MAVAQPPTPETQETKVVGQRVLRAEGRGLVSGRVKYIGDMYLPGMLHVKAKLAPYPNARITRIDTSKAEAHPGVVVVVTHKDVPSNRHGLRVPDQPVLVDEYARHLGEPVAAVAAVDEVTAADAVELIEVDYEPLEPVVDAFVAMQPDAPDPRGRQHRAGRREPPDPGDPAGRRRARLPRGRPDRREHLQHRRARARRDGDPRQRGRGRRDRQGHRPHLQSGPPPPPDVRRRHPQAAAPQGADGRRPGRRRVRQGH